MKYIIILLTIIGGTSNASATVDPEALTGEFHSIVCGLYNVKDPKRLEQQLTSRLGVDFAFAMEQAHCMTIEGTGSDFRGTFFMNVVRHRGEPKVFMSKIFIKLTQSGNNRDREALIHLLTGFRSFEVPNDTPHSELNNLGVDGVLSKEFSAKLQLKDAHKRVFQHWNIFKEINWILSEKNIEHRRRSLEKAYSFMCFMIRKYEIHEVYDLANNYCKS